MQLLPVASRAREQSLWRRSLRQQRHTDKCHTQRHMRCWNKRFTHPEAAHLLPAGAADRRADAGRTRLAARLRAAAATAAAIADATAAAVAIAAAAAVAGAKDARPRSRVRLCNGTRAMRACNVSSADRPRVLQAMCEPGVDKALACDMRCLHQSPAAGHIM
jgi:hypothetical protein